MTDSDLRVTEADLLVTGATLATLAGPAGPRGADAMDDVRLQENHAVAVRGDRITWVGPAEAWDGDAGRVLDAGGGLVTPGFVDPHTHLVYAGDRAFEIPMKLQGRPYLDILAAGGGIAHTVERTRAASVPRLVEEASARLRRMIASGTTSLEAKSGYGLSTPSELAMLEANAKLAEATGATIVSTFLGAHAAPPEYQDDVEGYVDLIIDEMLPEVAAQGIARYCDAFVEQGIFTPEHGTRIFAAARRHGLALRLHADEIVDTGGAALAARAGAVTADHLLQVSDEGIAALAAAGTTAVLLPTVPITMMQPTWAPGRKLLDAGVPVALATDHNPNNPVTDMGLVCQLGAYLLGLSPAQALTAATWNAAASLGIERDVGSIEVGKRADLLVHDVPDLEHWVVAPGRRTVREVVLGGRALTPA